MVNCADMSPGGERLEEAKEKKERIVKLYESGVLERVTGDTIRPGGIALTRKIAELAAIEEGFDILDIGCGKGSTAIFLSKEYQCHVTALDLSRKMISFAQNEEKGKFLKKKADFLIADGEQLPFHDSSFDTVISECSFSLLQNKENGAGEIIRVLKPHKKFIMSDVIIRGKVDEDIQSNGAFIPCLANTLRPEDYMELFKKVGFRNPYIEDHSLKLIDIGYDIIMQFGSMGAFLTMLLNEKNSCGPKKENHDALLTRYKKFVKECKPGYALIAVTKP